MLEISLKIIWTNLMNVSILFVFIKKNALYNKFSRICFEAFFKCPRKKALSTIQIAHVYMI